MENDFWSQDHTENENPDPYEDETDDLDFDDPDFPMNAQSFF